MQQRYKLPTLESPQALAERVRNIYIARKEAAKQSPNAKRLSYIDLLNFLPPSLQAREGQFEFVSLPPTKPYLDDNIYSLATGDFLGTIKSSQMEEEVIDANNIRLDELKAGFLIFMEEDIRRKEYKDASPKRKKGRFYSTGSELSEAIEEVLVINEENELRDEDRFIYLSDLYHHVQDNFDDDINHPLWQRKQNLLDDICLAMLKVKKRDEERIKLLTHGIPKLNMLIKYLREINDAYRKAASARMFTFLNSTNRLDLLDFSELIGEACLDTLTIENYDETCNVIIGLVLLGIMRIEADYNYLFSPKGGYLTNGSELWKSFMELLHVDELSYDDRIKYLRALSNNVANILGPDMEENRLKWIANIAANQSGPSDPKRIEHMMKKLKYHQEKIDAYINQLQIKKKQPCVAVRCISKGISFTAQWGISYVAAASVAPLVGGIAAGVLGGPVGVVVYTAAGTIVMSKLSGIIPGPVSWAYGWVLHKIGNAIGEGTVKAANYTFSVGKNGLRKLLGHPAIKKEDREFLQRYIDAILQAPSSVVSDKEKAQLRLVLGIEEEAELTLIRNLK